MGLLDGLGQCDIGLLGCQGEAAWEAAAGRGPAPLSLSVDFTSVADLDHGDGYGFILD